MSNIRKGLQMGFIGVGQCGSNIANEFAKLGYRAIAINTSETDLGKLTDIPELNRILITSGLQGAGKNPEIGKKAFEENMEPVFEAIEQVFRDEMDMYYVCFGLGGGTGTGIGPVLTDYLCQAGYSSGMILTFPSSDESPKTKIVSLAAFEELSTLKDIKSIFIIDNNHKIQGETIFGIKGQYNILNKSIADLMDVLNIHSTISSDIAFDARDLLTVLDTRGVASIFEVKIDDISSLKEESALSQLLVKAFKDTLFVKQDFTKSKACAILFDMPEKSEEYLRPSAIAKMKEELGVPFEVFMGVYENSSKKREGSIYILLSGLPFPVEFLKETETFLKNIENDLKTMFEDRETSSVKGSGAGYLSSFVTNKEKASPPKKQGSLRGLIRK